MSEEARVDSARIAGELGYIRGLIDALRTAPDGVDLTVFLDRIARVVSALEAVRERAADWKFAAEQEEIDGSGRPDLALGVVIACGAFADSLTKDISRVLFGEV